MGYAYWPVEKGYIGALVRPITKKWNTIIWFNVNNWKIFSSFNFTSIYLDFSLSYVELSDYFWILKFFPSYLFIFFLTFCISLTLFVFDNQGWKFRELVCQATRINQSYISWLMHHNVFNLSLTSNVTNFTITKWWHLI